MDALWTRQATLSWKDFESLSLAPDALLATRWLREKLSQLGYHGEGTDLQEPLTRFQRDTGLAADGILGSRTLLALYSRAGYPRPRLHGGAAS